MLSSTYERLHASSRVGKVFFRIWVAGGESPLVSHWRSGRSGFFSPHPFSVGLDNLALDERCDSRLLEADDVNPWVQDSILEHVRGDGRWLSRDREATGSHVARDTGIKRSITMPISVVGDTQRHSQSDLAGTGTNTSPWIVTYRNLDYAIHRIARLLQRDIGATIHLAVIEPGLEQGKTFERFTASAPHLQRSRSVAPRGSAERKLLDQACGFAEKSSEVLFYGRIFGESVKEDFQWTAQQEPFPLPSLFYREKSPTARPLCTPCLWLRELMWDPSTASYTTFLRYMKERERGVEEEEEEEEEHQARIMTF